MLPYNPLDPPSDTKQLVDYLRRETANIKKSLSGSMVSVTLTPTYAAPERVFDGLTVLALSPWNPGAGNGVYTYYSGAWNRLG